MDLICKTKTPKAGKITESNRHTEKPREVEKELEMARDNEKEILFVVSEVDWPTRHTFTS
jgi:hypothetical protein